MHFLDLAVELAAATVIVNLTGGFSSPFAALYFVTTGEAFALFGLSGAIRSALAASALGLAHLGPQVSLREAAAYGASEALLFLAAAILGAADWLRRRRAATVLPPRTPAELERQLDRLCEQGERLRAAHRDAMAALRQQAAAAAAATLRADLLACAIGEEEPAEAGERLLQVTLRSFGAASGALWTAEPGRTGLILAASQGAAAPVLADVFIDAGPDVPPVDVRRQCAGALAMALPREGQGEPSVIACVLRHGERLLGALALAAPAGARFPDDAQRRLLALSDIIAQVRRHLEWTARLQRRVREACLIYEIAGLAQTAPDADAFFAELAALMERALPAESCVLYGIDPAEGRLVVRAARGRPVNPLEHRQFGPGSGLAGWVADRRRQLLLPDLHRVPALLEGEAVLPRERSYLASPLAAGGRVLGVAALTHSRPGAFSAEDARLLGVIASQAARALEQGELLRSLERMAITDGLTHLHNRRYFQVRLEEEIRRARRYAVPVSLILLDIDHFKRVNDEMGHAAGDAVLVQLAGTLRAGVRETEIVARYGGEEFAILLPQTGCSDALVAAERLRGAVEAMTVQTAEGRCVRITISAGVAGCTAGCTAASLVADADSALYRAKQAGRNRVCAA